MSRTNYATNLSQRTPCILVLDASTSMETRDGGSTFRRIDLLNQGVAAFHEALQQDELAISRVQIACVNVGGPTDPPELMMDWCDAGNFVPFTLRAGGNTPLGRGVRLALHAIEQQKGVLRSQGISYTRPWLFILTDGEPTDPPDVWRSAVEQARAAEQEKRAEIFPIGVGDANLVTLGELSTRPPIRSNNLKFRELFIWLSASLGQVARSRPGDQISLPPVDPWAGVKL
jgi:uncharacterized protein YegL